jgi:hypothetical protein
MIVDVLISASASNVLTVSIAPFPAAAMEASAS